MKVEKINQILDFLSKSAVWLKGEDNPKIAKDLDISFFGEVENSPNFNFEDEKFKCKWEKFGFENIRKCWIPKIAYSSSGLVFYIDYVLEWYEGWVSVYENNFFVFDGTNWHKFQGFLASEDVEVEGIIDFLYYLMMFSLRK